REQVPRLLESGGIAEPPVVAGKVHEEEQEDTEREICDQLRRPSSHPRPAPDELAAGEAQDAQSDEERDRIRLRGKVVIRPAEAADEPMEPDLSELVGGEF